MSQSPKSGQFNSDIEVNYEDITEKQKSQSPKSGQFNSDSLTC